MRQTRKWTEKENKFLVAAIKSGNGAAEIAKFLGRSEKAVRRHCEELNIDVVAIKEKQKTASFTAVDVRCPFFRKLNLGKSIRCEGLTSSGYIINGFGNEDEWKSFVKTYCNKAYETCPIAKLLQNKYEGKT